jgi:hypothetical protein
MKAKELEKKFNEGEDISRYPELKRFWTNTKLIYILYL